LQCRLRSRTCSRRAATSVTASCIVSDRNDRAIQRDDPTYILDLVGRVVTVSMRPSGCRRLPVLNL
jgi:predicted helicase